MSACLIATTVGTLGIAAVGALVTIVAAVLARLTTVPNEIAAHDRRAGDRDTDLERWLTDRDVDLRHELNAMREQLNKDKLFYSGQYGVQIASLKTIALHQWRDQLSRAERDAATIYDRETLLHAAWRRIPCRRRPQYWFTVGQRAEPLLEVWRAPGTKHLTKSDPYNRSTIRRSAPSSSPSPAHRRTSPTTSSRDVSAVRNAVAKLTPNRLAWAFATLAGALALWNPHGAFLGAWTPNLGASWLEIASTIAIVDRLVRREARREVQPLRDRTLAQIAATANRLRALVEPYSPFDLVRLDISDAHARWLIVAAEDVVELSKTTLVGNPDLIAPQLAVAFEILAERLAAELAISDLTRSRRSFADLRSAGSGRHTATSQEVRTHIWVTISRRRSARSRPAGSR